MRRDDAPRLPSLYGRWLAAGFPLFAFPHHWLSPSAVGDRATRNPQPSATAPYLATDAARDEALRAFVYQNAFAVLLPLLERALAADSPSARRAAAELAHVERLLDPTGGTAGTAAFARALCLGSQAVVSAPQGLIHEVLGAWLPLKGSRDQPRERAWELLAPRLEALMRAASTAEAAEELTALAAPHTPRLAHYLATAVDPLLLAALSHVTSDLPPAGGAMADPVDALTADPGLAADPLAAGCPRLGMPIATVRKAIDVLARASSCPDAAYLLCESPGRTMDLLLLLHFADGEPPSEDGHVAPAPSRTQAVQLLRRGVHPSSMLATLELLVSARDHLLPPLLTPPASLSEGVQKAFPFVALARQLRHMALCQLPTARDFGRGPTVRRAAASTLQRCCVVLHVVLEAVIHPGGKARTMGSDARRARAPLHIVPQFRWSRIPSHGTPHS